MKSVLGPLTHAFQNGSNHIVIAVVVNIKFHRYSIASKQFNVVCKFLGCGSFNIERAKTARFWIIETGRLQMNEIRTIEVVAALP